MKRDLIDSNTEFLIESGHEEYVERSKRLHKAKDALLAPLKSLASEDHTSEALKAVAQALFESKTLEESDRDFSTEQLFSIIYGVKVHQSLESFKKLHAQLTDLNFTSRDNSYNPSGDNYYHALSVKIEPSENDELVASLSDKHMNKAPRKDRFKDVSRQIVIVENQSPMYAAILDYSVFTGEPNRFYLVRLKRDYTDADRLQELVEMDFDIENNSDWSEYNDKDPSYGIVAQLNIEDMTIKTVVEPKSIEHALFNVYSGWDALNEDRKHIEAERNAASSSLPKP